MLRSKTQPSLDEKIRLHIDEMNKLLDEAAAEQKKHCDGVPIGVIRRMFENQAPGCACRQMLKILKSEQS